MSIVDFWLVIIAAFFAGLLGTGWLRRYALHRELLDIPNERSSHSRPTPRGGGLSITLTVLVVFVWSGFAGDPHAGILVSLLPPLLLVGLIGWLEDHYELRILWRAGGYLLAAVWFVVFSDGLTEIAIGDSMLSTGMWNVPLLVLGLAWLTNLYNFMDGADALAGLQAVLAGLAGGILLWLSGGQSLSLTALVAAAAAAGFLFWNRPPAKIFMGDVGSCFLGFLFGALAILGEKEAGLPALLWVILLGFFIWDATFTLLMRVVRGERWYEAHRCHAYQRLLQMGWSHARLATGFVLYNLFVLWPLAAWGYKHDEVLLPAVLISLLVTLILWAVVQWQYARNRGAAC